MFDIDADGVREKVSWTSQDTEIAFLVLDRNENGTIDDGSELFGSSTKLRQGTIAEHGFEALAELDTSNPPDGKITQEDAGFATLRVWLDNNHNGISEPNELKTLQSARISALYTAFRESARIDQHGNAYRYEGTALVTRNRRDLPRRLFDVFFVVED
jgi:hypothetical protein